MQIQLKQPEIVVALKQFLVTQGISLAGKDVTIGFTAGRKEGGLTADISIEDIDGQVPGFTDTLSDEEAVAKPALKVVKTAEAVEETATPPQGAEDSLPVDAPAKATSSLFG